MTKLASTTPLQTPPTTNKHLIRWVEKMADLCQPASIHWLNGSAEEDAQLKRELVAAGTFTELDQAKWPGCFYARSSPNDVARVEDRTYICSLAKDNAGPTNNWEDPFVMRKKAEGRSFKRLHARAHHVRHAVSPWVPSVHPCRRLASSLTDSAYAVVNMRIMARIGAD